jgi:hypothetical protein
MPKRAVTAVSVVALLAAVAAGPAAAAKRGAGATAGPALTGPAIAYVGATYTITGSGFVPGSLVPLEIGEASGCCIALNMVADEEGRFSYTGEVWAAGAYSVRALALRNGGRWRVAASWSFQAYP